MKRITRILVVCAIFTMLFAMPVMARDVSFASENTDYLITLLNNNAAKMQGELSTIVKATCGPNADAVIANQTALVNNKIATINKECAENHIDYLNKKLYNKTVLEGTRLKQLNWFKELAQQSSSWNDEVAFAQKEYDTVVAERIAAEAKLAEAKVKLAPYL